MPRTHPRCQPEFRAEAVRLVQETEEAKSRIAGQHDDSTPTGDDVIKCGL